MKEERKFGVLVGGVFVCLAFALVLKGSRIAGPLLGGAGALLVLLGAAAPRLLGPVHRAWNAFARLLGRLNTAVFLGLVWFLVLTPLGIALRLSGRDVLERRRPRRSGWIACPERARDPRHFEKMY